MVARGFAALAWVACALAAIGCTGQPETLPEPQAEPSVTSPTVVEEPAATGRPAPKRGEAGHEQLPTCQGRQRATTLGTGGDDRIVATRAVDVIVTFGGDDHV